MTQVFAPAQCLQYTQRGEALSSVREAESLEEKTLGQFYSPRSRFYPTKTRESMTDPKLERIDATPEEIASAALSLNPADFPEDYLDEASDDNEEVNDA